jgi:nicotinate dehydrogenase subunit B
MPIHQFHLSRERAITSLDWNGYPILTFNEIPRAGEGTVGPSSAALVNAVSQVVGKRMRDLPLTPQRIQQKLAG